jgi:hypothetical protein
MTTGVTLKKVMHDIIDSAFAGRQMKDADRVFRALSDHYRLLGCIGEIRDALTQYANTVNDKTDPAVMREAGSKLVDSINAHINEALS